MNKQMDSVLQISDLPFEMYGFYEDIFSSMQDMVRVIDKNGLVVYQNEPMLGEVGSFIGMKCHSLFANDVACRSCICHNQIKCSGPLSKEVTLNAKNYSVISALLKNSPGYYVEVFRDITISKKHEEKVKDQNNKMKSDLEFAKTIQKNLIPSKGRYSEMIYFSGVYKPAELLGGDMFDIVEIDDDNIAFYIADVSGHGVTSSLVTMFVNQTLKNMKSFATQPCNALKILMEKYMQLGIAKEKYFTILYCVYNRKTQQVKISNAGHNCLPIHIKASDESVCEIDTVGIPICEIYDYAVCSKTEFKIESGDKLLLYTDGISEAKNRDGIFFAEKIDEVIENNKKQVTSDLVNEIIKSTLRHSSGVICDDMAIMGIEFL